jgi:hypothetical protein
LLNEHIKEVTRGQTRQASPPPETAGRRKKEKKKKEEEPPPPPAPVVGFPSIAPPAPEPVFVPIPAPAPIPAILPEEPEPEEPPEPDQLTLQLRKQLYEKRLKDLAQQAEALRLKIKEIEDEKERQRIRQIHRPHLIQQIPQVHNFLIPDPVQQAEIQELIDQVWNQEHEDEEERARRDMEYRNEVLHAQKIYNNFDEWLREQGEDAQAKIIKDIYKHCHQGDNYLFNLKRLNSEGYKRFFLLFRHILTTEIAYVTADNYFIKFKLLGGNWQTHILNRQIFQQILKNIDEHEFLFSEVSPQLYFMMSGQDVEHEFNTFEAIHIVKQGENGGAPLGGDELPPPPEYGQEYIDEAGNEPLIAENRLGPAVAGFRAFRTDEAMPPFNQRAAEAQYQNSVQGFGSFQTEFHEENGGADVRYVYTGGDSKIIEYIKRL